LGLVSVTTAYQEQKCSVACIAVAFRRTSNVPYRHPSRHTDVPFLRQNLLGQRMERSFEGGSAVHVRFVGEMPDPHVPLFQGHRVFALDAEELPEVFFGKPRASAMRPFSSAANGTFRLTIIEL
jgi:hypothetical protein